MSSRMMCVVSSVLVLGVVGSVFADNVYWNNTTGDGLWSNMRNWSATAVPTAGDMAHCHMVPGPIVRNEGAVADAIPIGEGAGTGDLTVDGGTLTVNTWILLAWGPDSSGTLNVDDGVVTTNYMMVGEAGTGTLNITGGTIRVVGGSLKIGGGSQAKAHANLAGGVIVADYFLMRADAAAVGTMDVKGGKLILSGNQLALVQEYIDNGWITAYDGEGTLNLDYDVTNSGKTTLTAIHALKPYPADGGVAQYGEVELSWTLPDPCVPGESVLVDVYFTDDRSKLEQFTDPEAIQVISQQNADSVVVTTEVKTWYYWAVDLYLGGDDDPILGPIFSFFADNLPPDVDAGADIVTWLENDIRTGHLDATVIDSDACTVAWTVIEEPNTVSGAVIEDANSEDTVVTLSATGQYVLLLEASDGEYTSSDTLTISVYGDRCEAARSLPEYEPLVGDLNGDCVVDDIDMALLQENWLKDNSLPEEWFEVD